MTASTSGARTIDLVDVTKIYRMGEIEVRALDKVSMTITEGDLELNDAGRAVVLITHEDEVAAYAKRVITLCDGQIVDDCAQLSLPGRTGSM